MLIRTDKQVDPAMQLPCPTCGNSAEWVGSTTIDEDEEIWNDKYWCKHCMDNFDNSALPLWCDPDTGDFYAYQDAADGR